jgi:hypothetical protein
MVLLCLFFFKDIECFFKNSWLVAALYMFVTIIIFIPFLFKNNDIIKLKETFFKKENNGIN